MNLTKTAVGALAKCQRTIAATMLLAMALNLAGPVVCAQEGKKVEGREQWYADGQRAVEEAKQLRAQSGRAKNVILFVGDGMGISTVTAARILEGQMRGQSGEENLLSFERLPYVALSKTYSTNQQTADSAPTMTAIITGVKTQDGFISVDQDAVSNDHNSVKGHELRSFLEIAEAAGLSTGVVTTARLTHATPAACYAHTPERAWETNANLPPAAQAAGFPDIARQLIEFPGNGLEVALGGGRGKFLPKTMPDPEDAGNTGERTDGRNLADEWVRKGARSAYVWNKTQFDAVNARSTDRLLGLFDRSHMEYEHDRLGDGAGEPSLSEMTSKAIDILAKNPKGYFLMVEGGRIDHAHHDGNAFRALTEAIELSRAVKVALEKTDQRETLIVVTADHSHTLTIGGYPTRGNNILGKVRGNDAKGNPAAEYAKDSRGLPYTTLNYANGRGYAGPPKNPNGRPDLSNVDTSDPNYLQEALVPMTGETHGGEDVAIYAGGPGAYLFHGVQEQNVIFHVMLAAMRLSPKKMNK